MLALIVVAIMLGFPTAFTLMGMGVLFGWLAYRSVNPRDRHATDPRPDGAARVFGDVERRADRDPAVRVHGLPGRALEPDRRAVQEPAPGDWARFRRRSAVATPRHLRRFRHCDGDRRCRGCT
jgi:hypothetical protein